MNRTDTEFYGVILRITPKHSTSHTSHRTKTQHESYFTPLYVLDQLTWIWMDFYLVPTAYGAAYTVQSLL